MAEVKKIKPPVDEEAHFRVDEIERRLVPIESGMKPEVVAALITGAVAALRVELEQSRKESDAALMDEIKKDVIADKELVAVVRELIELMKKPTIREVTLNGQTMTVKESK